MPLFCDKQFAEHINHATLEIDNFVGEYTVPSAPTRVSVFFCFFFQRFGAKLVAR